MHVGSGGTPGGLRWRSREGRAQLRVPTLAERLRARWPESRSVAVSLKARSAIMMAGKDATAVTMTSIEGRPLTAAARPLSRAQ